MLPRLLLFAVGFYQLWGTLEGEDTSDQTTCQNSEAFKKILQSFNRSAGPLGYYNSLYMAFTREEAKQFPDLVSCHSQMMLIKSGDLLSTSSILNETHIHGTALDENNFQNKLLLNRKRGRGRNTKRATSYPVTVITGPCENTTGGLTRLCKVCPAITDLGPDKVPRYINEVLCQAVVTSSTFELCGVPELFGICQNTALKQDFLLFTGNTAQVYSQEIRVCCECSLFPWLWNHSIGYQCIPSDYQNCT